VMAEVRGDGNIEVISAVNVWNFLRLGAKRECCGDLLVNHFCF